MATMVPIPGQSFHANVSDLYGDRDGTTPAPAPVLPPDPIRSAYRAAVQEVATKAKAALPDSGGRVDAAVQIVLVGDVELQPDGSAHIRSQSHGAASYIVVNGICGCRDFLKAPQGQCKHRLARGIASRAYALASAMLEAQAAASAQPQEDQPTPAPVEQATPELTHDMQLLAPYVVHIHGKPFVQYAGLLQLAHARGLQELSAIITLHIDGILAIATAVAVFADGKRFTESGGSVPQRP
jgi:hypothetical protein